MNSNSEMTFLEHFSELRTRIFKMFLSIALFAIIGYIYSNQLIEFLIQPIDDPDIKLQVLKITSIFTTKLMVSFFTGFLLSVPVIIYQALFFIKPAFSEKITIRKIYMYILLSLFLCVIGILFGYYILIPASIGFFKNISLDLINSININLTLDGYLTYFIWILILSSFVYQLPIFILILVKTGMVDILWLQSNRRYAIVLFFIFGALLSPPDPISQIFVALPLIFLYELSILLSKIFHNE